MQMINYLFLAKVISCLSFAYYGMCCLHSKKIENEFKRYKLSRFRKMTGYLQLCGSLGLAIGFYFPILTMLSSLGLTLLMLLGVITRIKIKDSFLETSPALFFFLLNFYIFFNICCQ
jgi:uncharacterized membrane protein YphA (DoxX/SURF4 family)